MAELLVAAGIVIFVLAMLALIRGLERVLQRQRASPFENPTGLTNLLSIALILCIAVALTYTFGKMVGSIRQGAAILDVMAIIFSAWLATADHSTSHATSLSKDGPERS